MFRTPSRLLQALRGLHSSAAHNQLLQDVAPQSFAVLGALPRHSVTVSKGLLGPLHRLAPEAADATASEQAWRKDAAYCTPLEGAHACTPISGPSLEFVPQEGGHAKDQCELFLNEPEPVPNRHLLA